MPTVTITPSAAPVWTGYPGAAQVLFVNLDTTDSITLANNAGINAGDTSGINLSPLGSIALPGTSTWYAITATATGPLLQVISGAANWSIAPSDLFTELIASGFAAELAIAIQQSGVSLLSTPKLIHNSSIKSTTGTPANFGVTISDDVPAQLGVGSNNSAGYSAAIAKFETFLSQGPTPTFQAKAGKIFGQGIQTSGTVTPTSKLSGMYTQGYEAVYICFTPSLVTGAPTAQNISDSAGMKYVLDQLTAAHPGTELRCFIFQEVNSPSKGISTTNFGLSCDYYYNTSPTKLRPTYKCGVCLASAWTQGGGGTPAIALWSAYAFAPSTVYDMLGADFYATSFNPGGRLDSGTNKGPAGNNIATIAHTLNIPWGVTEIGEASDGSVQATTQYFQHIQSVLSNEIASGRSTIHSMYFEGQVNQTNVITSTSDSRVNGPNYFLETMVAGIITAPVTGIAAGATAVLAPIAGSPVAGFAISDTFSYDISVNLIASGGSTIPFAIVRIDWFNQDNPLATPIDSQSWMLPAGTNATVGTFINGVGPQRGQFWQISVTNLDTVQMSVIIQTNASARAVKSDVWKWDAASSVAVPTFTLATAGPAFTRTLGTVKTLNVPHGTTVSRLFGMCPGYTFIRFSGAGLANFSFTIQPAPTSQWNGAALLNESPTTAEFEDIILVPNAPLLLAVTNGDAADHAITVMMVSLE